MLNLRSRAARVREHGAQERLRVSLARQLSTLLRREFRLLSRVVAHDLSERGVDNALVHHRHRLATLLRHFYSNVFHTFGKRTALKLVGVRKSADSEDEDLDATPDLPDSVWRTAAEAYVDDWTAKKVSDVDATTKKNIRAYVGSGLDKGKSYSQVADDVFAEIGDQARADLIARTEVHSASQAASLAVAQKSGLDLDHQWLAVDDAKTRDDHLDADGQTVALDEPFEVGGEELAFPGDPNASASQVCNCRCVEVYTTKESE
jgi:hypothetical protein